MKYISALGRRATHLQCKHEIKHDEDFKIKALMIIFSSEDIAEASQALINRWRSKRRMNYATHC